MDVVLQIFRECCTAIRRHVLIHRQSRTDKEYHFQNWVRDRLSTVGVQYEVGGRNTYPDLRLVQPPVGFEVKGLAYPGREVNYDSNSQVPTGSHNGRTIYYVFGRYPADPDGPEYPVVDLVICHGDFLNADHTYVHKNRSVKGFGTYGDIMIRDRKMYVPPTPYGLLEGVAHSRTLVLPFTERATPHGFGVVGNVVRREADAVIVGYNFDLRTNEMTCERVDNPNAGREHRFQALRLAADPPGTAVALRVISTPDGRRADEDDDR